MSRSYPTLWLVTVLLGCEPPPPKAKVPQSNPPVARTCTDEDLRYELDLLDLDDCVAPEPRGDSSVEIDVRASSVADARFRDAGPQFARECVRERLIHIAFACEWPAPRTVSLIVTRKVHKDGWIDWSGRPKAYLCHEFFKRWGYSMTPIEILPDAGYPDPRDFPVVREGVCPHR